MKEIVLGKTGLKIVRMGMGGIPIQRLSPTESDKLLETAVEQGINFFDTARVYTDSEQKMGRILPKYKDKVYIATKTYSRGAKGTEEDVDISLNNLKVDNIDLYQCHNISSEEDLKKILAPGGAIEALKRAKEKGKIKHIGISSHKPWIAKKALDHIETIQIPFNIIENKALEELIPEAKKKNVGIIGMKPIAGGAMEKIELNFRYILMFGVDVVIPGIDKLEQIPKDISVLDNLKPLTEDELKELETERERLGDCFCRRCEYCMPCPEGLNIPFLHLVKAYYFLYDLKDWSWERLNALPKAYADCTECRECVSKCPYDLDTPEIFKDTWQKIKEDREL